MAQHTLCCWQLTCLDWLRELANILPSKSPPPAPKERPTTALHPLCQDVTVPSVVFVAYSVVNKLRLVIHKRPCTNEFWRCSRSLLSAWDVRNLTEGARTIELLTEMMGVFYYVTCNFLLTSEINIRGNAWGSHNSAGVSQCKGFEWPVWYLQRYAAHAWLLNRYIFIYIYLSNQQ